MRIKEHILLQYQSFNYKRFTLTITTPSSIHSAFQLFPRKNRHPFFLNPIIL